MLLPNIRIFKLSISGLRRPHGGRNCNPLQYSWEYSGKFHGQRSLKGYSPKGCKESDVTDWLSSSSSILSSIRYIKFKNGSVANVVKRGLLWLKTKYVLNLSRFVEFKGSLFVGYELIVLLLYSLVHRVGSNFHNFFIQKYLFTTYRGSDSWHRWSQAVNSLSHSSLFPWDLPWWNYTLNTK